MSGVRKSVTRHQVPRSDEYAFQRFEFHIDTKLRKEIESEIRNLTSDARLYDFYDKGKMVPLSDFDIAAIQKGDGSPDDEDGIKKIFGSYFRLATEDDFNNASVTCQQITREAVSASDAVVSLVTDRLPELVTEAEAISDDPFSYLVIYNSPIEFPFGQHEDSRFQNRDQNTVVRDRFPTAEIFQAAMLAATGHTLDAPFPGRSFVKVTPDLSKLDREDNSLYEEESASQPFIVHTDGANYNEASSQVSLAVGTGDIESKTNFVHIGAVLEELAELDNSDPLPNGMPRAKLLGKNIFEHGPGANSVCLNVVQAPILLEDFDGSIRPRLNLTSGRVTTLDEQLQKYALSNENISRVINQFQLACDNPSNQHTLVLETGQVVHFSGELLHGRSAFDVNEENPRFALRVRGTSRKHCDLIALRNERNPQREPYQPGV